MKKLFIVLFGCLSFLFISGCGHSLSGTYESGDYRIEFSKNGSVKWVESATSLNGVYQYNDNGTYVINIDYGGMVVGYIVNEEDDGSLLVNGGFLSNKKFVKSGMTEEISKDDDKEIEVKENKNYGKNKTLDDLTIEDLKRLFGGGEEHSLVGTYMGRSTEVRLNSECQAKDDELYVTRYSLDSTYNTNFPGRTEWGKIAKNEGEKFSHREGLWTLYDKDCNILTQCEYRNGEPYNGLCMFVQLREVRYYVDGETDGRYYSIYYSGHKDNPNYIGIERYTIKEIKLGNENTGDDIYYYENGQVKRMENREGDDENGFDRDGERVYYNEDGKVTKKEIYKKGELISEKEY